MKYNQEKVEKLLAVLEEEKELQSRISLYLQASELIEKASKLPLLKEYDEEFEALLNEAESIYPECKKYSGRSVRQDKMDAIKKASDEVIENRQILFREYRKLAREGNYNLAQRVLQAFRTGKLVMGLDLAPGKDNSHIEAGKAYLLPALMSMYHTNWNCDRSNVFCLYRFELLLK